MKPDRPGDAIIIGAGIIGLCVAYYLSRRGLKVLVLDRQFIACGTSGAGNGNIIVGNRVPGMDTRLARSSLREYHVLREALPLDFELQNRGSFVLLENETDIPAALRLVEEQSGAGVPLEYHDAKGIRSIIPLLSDACVGGIYCRDDSAINPLLFVRALKQGVEDAGGRVACYDEVTSVAATKGGSFTVTTRSKEYSCGTLVSCAGAGTPRIAGMLGDEIPVIANKGLLVVTEKVPALNLGFPLRDWRDVDMDTDRSRTNSPAGHEINFVAEPTKEGNILIGKCEDLGNSSRSVSIPIAAEILRRAVAFIPRLKQVKVIRMYAGLRPQSADGLPVVGESARTRACYYATGHGGDGIALGPITGKLLSELILDGHAEIDIAGYSPSRFTGATTPHHTGGESWKREY
jgi:glycine/D-amino acid oxidase-like deaminating enzyme